MTVKLTRRNFVELAAGSTAALGLSLFKYPEFHKLFAQALKEVPVIWFQGSGCNGCSVSVLNTVPITIQNLLLSEVVTGQHISMRFHNTIMAAQGAGAIILGCTEISLLVAAEDSRVPLFDTTGLHAEAAVAAALA